MVVLMHPSRCFLKHSSSGETEDLAWVSVMSAVLNRGGVPNQTLEA